MPGVVSLVYYLKDRRVSLIRTDMSREEVTNVYKIVFDNIVPVSGIEARALARRRRIQYASIDFSRPVEYYMKEEMGLRVMVIRSPTLEEGTVRGETNFTILIKPRKPIVRVYVHLEGQRHGVLKMYTPEEYFVSFPSMHIPYIFNFDPGDVGALAKDTHFMGEPYGFVAYLVAPPRSAFMVSATDDEVYVKEYLTG